MAKRAKPEDITILAADDDIDILRIIHKRLTQRGFNVVTADDGEEAIEKIVTEKPDGVILDVMMPKLSGWEVCRYLRERPAHDAVGVVMLTAIGATLNELTSPLYGADEYLDKPIDLDDLDGALARILEKRAGLLLG